MSPLQTLRRVCQTFGISIAPIDLLVADLYRARAPSQHGDSEDIERASRSACVYEAQSWTHLASALFGTHFVRCWLSQSILRGELSVPSWWRPQPAAARVPSVLVVSGSDSGAGAGMQADLKTCHENGVYACTALSALTAQNTRGVQVRAWTQRNACAAVNCTH
jgi:hypothetical protein